MAVVHYRYNLRHHCWLQEFGLDSVVDWILGGCQDPQLLPPQHTRLVFLLDWVEDVFWMFQLVRLNYQPSTLQLTFDSQFRTFSAVVAWAFLLAIQQDRRCHRVWLYVYGY